MWYPLHRLLTSSGLGPDIFFYALIPNLCNVLCFASKARYHISLVLVGVHRFLWQMCSDCVFWVVTPCSIVCRWIRGFQRDVFSFRVEVIGVRMWSGDTGMLQEGGSLRSTGEVEKAEPGQLSLQLACKSWCILTTFTLTLKKKTACSFEMLVSTYIGSQHKRPWFGLVFHNTHFMNFIWLWTQFSFVNIATYSWIYCILGLYDIYL